MLCVYGKIVRMQLYCFLVLLGCSCFQLHFFCFVVPQASAMNAIVQGHLNLLIVDCLACILIEGCAIFRGWLQLFREVSRNCYWLDNKNPQYLIGDIADWTQFRFFCREKQKLMAQMPLVMVEPTKAKAMSFCASHMSPCCPLQ